jgi:Fe-S cluster assembly protein SufD
MLDTSAYVTKLKDFDSGPGSGAPAWVRNIRKAAIARFAADGFPSTKNEDWRFTRIRPILQHDFRLLEKPSSNGLSVAQLGEMSFPDAGCVRLVFLNGHFVGGLSSMNDLPQGLHVATLREAIDTDRATVQRHLAEHDGTSQSPFVALNTGYLLDGAFVHIAKNALIDKPIHLVFVSAASSNGGVMSHPRNLIVADEGSSATVIESYVGPPGAVYFTNAVTEASIGDNADIEHYRVQKESQSAFHMASLSARLGRDSRFDTDYVSMGGGLVRNDVITVLDGEGIDCRLDGLYVATGHQHVDNHTNIEHTKPHCESHEMYKGILGGRAKGVFNGKIHVHPDAQKTDAKQSNGCMLLSDDAQINTNPQLEIYADDVKCTHGATVGQIDENAVFYLRSRGIAASDARHMLVHAFANEVLERIKVEPLRERLAADLFAWLAAVE